MSRLIHGDCLEVLAELEPDSIDACVTDPPYGTGGWRRTVAGAGGDPSGSLVVEEWDDGATTWLGLLPQSVRVVMVFWPAARTLQLLQAAVSCGLTKHRTLYMRKPDPKPMVAGRTRWSVEPIWVLSADGFTLMGGDDVYTAQQPRSGRNVDASGHPYEKPRSVMRWLLGKLGMEGGTVLDPFMGSGTTGVACAEEGFDFIGIEREEEYCEIARRRIGAAEAQLRLSV